MNVLSDSAIDRKNEKIEYTIYARRKQSLNKIQAIQYYSIHIVIFIVTLQNFNNKENFAFECQIYT